MLTPDEANDLAMESLEGAKLNIDAASIILTGGDPNTSDFFELLRKLGEVQDRSRALIRRFLEESQD